MLPSIANARKASTVFDANNHIRQSEAMIGLDVSASFGGAMEKAAAAVKAKDGAEVLELRTSCGHLAPDCEALRLASSVNAFLAQ